MWSSEATNSLINHLQGSGSTFISQLFFSTLNIGVASGTTKVFDMEVVESLGKSLNQI